MMTGTLQRTTLISLAVLLLLALASGCSDDDGGSDNLNNTGDDAATIQCGNGELEGMEECDDGGGNSDTVPNACRSNCLLPGCGDGVIDDEEACDDGPQNSDIVPDACRADCTEPLCGDGVVDVVSGESCDDGNMDAGDYCSPLCQIEVCGNGELDPGEVCDDGNLMPLDGCSQDCQSEEWCGNGYPDYLKMEQCDDSNHLSHDGCSSGCTAEFPAWTEYRPALGAMSVHSIVYDSARDRLVLFGGSGSCGHTCNDTYEHDGVRWRRIETPNKPPARNRAMLAYDSARGVTVLFGGDAASYWLDDTWEYDGTDWTQIATTNAPSPRAWGAMAYHALDQRVVLYGGEDGNGSLSGTWEYDGVDWSGPSDSSPDARTRMRAVYDSQRQVLVMFGGATPSSGDSGETWEYDGSSWSLVTTTGIERSAYSMAYDSSRHVTVMFSGSTSDLCGNENCADVHEYNGTTWTDVTPATPGPGSRVVSAMAFNPTLGKVVLMGGLAQGVMVDDTWTWDGTVWENQDERTLPAQRARHAMVYDPVRDQLVMFSGEAMYGGGIVSNDIWLFDGEGWLRQPCSSNCPEVRMGHAMVWDSLRERVVLFGGKSDDGSGGGVVMNDTWEWDGTSWAPGPAAPPLLDARLQHSMAFDPVRGLVVLIGGHGDTDPSAPPYGDMWEYDGSSWTQASPAHMPSARGMANLTWDDAHQELVLYGGMGAGSVMLDDTWTFDGADWTERNPQYVPPGRGWAVMQFDPLRSRVILFGGVTLASFYSDMWEWDGSDWTQIFANPTTPRGFAASAYHAGLSSIAVHGGSNGGTYLQDTQLLQYDSDWPEEVCDSGQDDDQDGDVDCADPDCEGRACAVGMVCTGGACVTP